MNHFHRTALCLATASLAAIAHAQTVTDASLQPQVGNASDVASPERQAWNLHAQLTATSQFHPRFRSDYEGANSMDSGFSEKETVDLTLFAGMRLWSGAALYANPEVDQGFGLQNTLGLAGFSSGEAYKVGARNPYFRLPRLFVRQIVDLGGDSTGITDAANQLAGPQSEDNLVLTVGKFSVPDVFDTNRYANNARADFLNWSLLNSGAYDYAADAWAFTYGAAAEWTKSTWTLRGGLFALSKVPNSKDIDGTFDQFEGVLEGELRHEWYGQPGKLKALVYANRGRMGRYADATALAAQTGTMPDTSAVRRYASRPGLAVSMEQELASGLGAFARASINHGAYEAYEFTEINRSVAAGLSLQGTRWKRPDDTVGVAAVVNGISNAARTYFADGGMGILIGDGRLPNYGLEKIVETYYARKMNRVLTVSADCQRVTNPAYNRDRGPVSIFGVRIHAEI